MNTLMRKIVVDCFNISEPFLSPLIGVFFVNGYDLRIDARWLASAIGAYSAKH